LRPSRLCHELRVDHRVRVGRLIRFGLLWFLLVHLMAFAIAFASTFFTGSGLPGWWARGGGTLLSPLYPDFWTTMLRVLILPYAWSMSVPTGVGSRMTIPLAPF